MGEVSDWFINGSQNVLRQSCSETEVIIVT
jgi:hypothetical protein